MLMTKNMGVEQSEESVQSSTHTAPFSGEKSYTKKKKNIRIIVRLSIVVALVLGTIFWYVIVKNVAYSPISSLYSVCDSTVLEKAKTAIDNSDTNSLLDVVSDITSKDGYWADANCLYVVNVYGAKTVLPDEVMINSFTQYYDSKKGLDPVLDVSQQDVPKLEFQWAQALKEYQEKQIEITGKCTDTYCIQPSENDAQHEGVQQ